MNDTRAEILIVDDEPSICEMLAFSLRKLGYKVRSAHDAKQALTMLGDGVPDVMLIDWMMPGMNGVELVRCLRAEPATQQLPIIMLTAKDSEDNKIEGLTGGADDYIVKPFSNRELHARVKALLRRAKPYEMKQKIKSGALTLDPQVHQIALDGQTISFTPTEFHLLYFLVTHENQVLSRQHILNNIWGAEKFISERTVDVQIRRLRKKLAQYSQHNMDRCIQTVRGIGYRYEKV